MAITVIKPSEMGNHASFGQELGQSLGQGFQGALRGLAEGKVADLLGKQQERKMHKQREDLVKAGYSESDADAILAGYSPEQIKLMQILNSGRGPQGQENAMQIGQPMGQPQGNDQNMLSSLLGQSQQGGGQQDAIIQNLMKMLQTPQQQQQIPQMQQQAQPQMQQMPQMQTPQQSIGAQQKFQPLTTAQKIAQYETPQMKLQRELAANKETNTQQRHIDKLNSKFNDSIDAKAESAERQQHALDVMKELDDTGQLDKTGYVTALKHLGLDYDVLLKPGTSLFKKMGATFLQDLKSVFPGGKITNQEMDAWLAGVPNLLQTKEGRAQLYEVLGAANKGAAITQSVRDSIIERNGDREPKNLRSLTLKESKPQIDKLQNKLVEDIRSRSSKFESLPSPYSVPRGEVLTNHTTKESKRNTGSGWKTIPYRPKKG